MGSPTGDTPSVLSRSVNLAILGPLCTLNLRGRCVWALELLWYSSSSSTFVFGGMVDSRYRGTAASKGV